MSEITLEEYLAAVAESEAPPADNALTTNEIGAAMGWGERRTRRIIREYVRDGKLVPVRVRRFSVVGILNTVWAYRKPEGGKR